MKYEIGDIVFYILNEEVRSWLIISKAHSIYLGDITRPLYLDDAVFIGPWEYYEGS